jgi:hypothetical protein
MELSIQLPVLSYGSDKTFLKSQVARDEVPSSAKVKNASTPHVHGVVFRKWKSFILSFFLEGKLIVTHNVKVYVLGDVHHVGLASWFP